MSKAEQGEKQKHLPFLLGELFLFFVRMPSGKRKDFSARARAPKKNSYFRIGTFYFRIVVRHYFKTDILYLFQ